MVSDNAKYFLKNHRDQIESGDYTALIRDAADLSGELAKEIVQILKDSGVNYKGIREYILDRKELAEAITQMKLLQIYFKKSQERHDKIYEKMHKII